MNRWNRSGSAIDPEREQVLVRAVRRSDPIGLSYDPMKHLLQS
jgi:hypothetical protein